MKVGDLVIYVDLSGKPWKETGVIIKEIPGWGQFKVVMWSKSGLSSHEAKNLVVVNESR
jgi:hypothetical protein